MFVTFMVRNNENGKFSICPDMRTVQAYCEDLRSKNIGYEVQKHAVESLEAMAARSALPKITVIDEWDPDKKYQLNDATRKAEEWINDNPDYWKNLGAFANTDGPITAAKQLIAKACDAGYITENEMKLVDQRYFASKPELRKAMKLGYSLTYSCWPDDYDF